jgi:hypothetical protein
MYLRLVRFTLSAAGRSSAQTMADDLIPRIKQQPGCQSATFFAGDDGSSGLAVLWDTQDHADAASRVIRPQLDQHLSGNVTAPPDVQLFPVLAS